MNSLHEIIQELKKPGPILLTSHIMPDGDSIGSLLGLGLAMLRAGYEITMFSADSVPGRYRFLEGADLITVHTLPPLTYQRVIVLDCSDHLRIEPIWEEIKNSYIINIDHHPTNRFFGRQNYVDTEASATGEIVYALLVEMGLSIDRQVAAALYVALATDTGSFKFENTTARTHRIAADLMDAGVNPRDITPTVFDLRPRAGIFILRNALNSLRFSEDGKVAWMSLTEDNMQQYGAKDEDLEGVVNFAKNIEDVEVGLIFRAKENGSVKVGMRSHNVDVGKIADSLGGGGHARAAGCSLDTDLDTAVETVLEAVRQVL